MLSIVIPQLNEAEGIVEHLQALQKWRPDVELIVVDGGSVDNSVELARPLVDHIVVVEPGRAKQMNAGAQLARGHYLLFLHADTRLPDRLLESLAGWRKREALWGFFRLRLSGDHWLLRWVERGVNWRSKLTSVATGDQCLFVERQTLKQLGYFPVQPLMEDVALSKILRRRARPLMDKQRVVSSSRRWERRGIVRTILLMWRLRLAYFLGADAEALAERYYPGYKLASKFNHE